MSLKFTVVARKNLSKGAPEDSKLFYAQARQMGTVGIDELCDEIAETCTLTRRTCCSIRANGCGAQGRKHASRSSWPRKRSRKRVEAAMKARGRKMLLLLLLGFWVPPVGIIDSSVLVAFGEMSTFAGALLGIDYRYRYDASKHYKK